jgi:DNA-binding CsgD family transcriptional regulator
MAPGEHEGSSNKDRLLAILQQLLALQADDLKPALDAAAQAVADAMVADKVDVFLHRPADHTLVAVGTSDTPMGRQERQLGLDVLRIAAGGTTTRVFQTGQSRLTGHLDRDPEELRGIVEGLGVRSQVGVPILAAGERCGVLMICSATPERFSQDDLRFAESVAHWVALVGYRAAHIERLASEVAEASLRVAAENLIATLTPRQREIAALISSGLTNAEIAQQLVLTPGTVANHVEHILDRLGFRSRTQVGIWAVEGGLHRPQTHTTRGQVRRAGYEGRPPVRGGGRAVKGKRTHF